MAWIWTVISVILLVNLLQHLMRKKSNFPPGPVALPIIGHFHLLGKNPHQDLHRMARKHGAIMGLRFGFVPVLVISSPAAAELVLKTHDLVFASRPMQYSVKQISYGQRNLVFAPYGPYWRNMRKLCTLKLLSNHRINQFQGMRKAEVGLMVASLKQAAARQETVDLSEEILGVSRDMNCLMIFGHKFGNRDLGEKGFKAMTMELLVVSGKFNLADNFPYVGALDLQGLNGKMKRLSQTFDGFLERIIDEHVRNKQEKDTEDFVDTMMGIMESGEAPFEFDRRHVKALLLDLLVAGMDTSATALEWAMSELIKHPHVMTKLQKELESIVGLDNMVEESHLDKLEYLNCVVKETQRLHPVGPLLLPHESMEDCIVDGFYVPKISRVIVNVWAIGRDPNIWSDVETFFPERFVGSNIDLRGHDFQLIPFGSGRRGCPGLQLGVTLVGLVLAQLVHCFNWKLPDDMKPSELDMTEHFGLATGRAKRLKAIPSYRLRI